MTAHDELISPIGTSTDVDRESRADADPIFRARWDEMAEFRDVAWLLIKYRMDHDLSQQQVAERVGMSVARIARIESGRFRTSLDTLRRIASGLDLKMVVGFESTSSDGRPERQLITL